jgi:hypothetical protein
MLVFKTGRYQIKLTNPMYGEPTLFIVTICVDSFVGDLMFLTSNCIGIARLVNMLRHNGYEGKQRTHTHTHTQYSRGHANTKNRGDHFEACHRITNTSDSDQPIWVRDEAV